MLMLSEQTKVETEQINNELTQAKQGLTVDKQPLINAKLLCNKV